MSLRSALNACLILILPALAAADTIYVGTYTGSGSKGIYAVPFDETTGTFGEARLAAATPSPSFLILSPQGDRLFAANELGLAEGGGAASSFAVEGDHLRALSLQSSQGGDPCDLALSPDGRQLFVANYETGNVAELPVRPDGRLEPALHIMRFGGSGPNLSRQRSPHAHCAVVDPSGRFLLVCDLGSDRIRVFGFDSKSGGMMPAPVPVAKLPPGSGPRHLVFAPSGREVYLISELASSVTALRWDPQSARLTPFQTLSTLPENFRGTQTAAEIQIDSAGRYLYASNRGDDNSLAVFAVAPDGRLSFLQHIDCAGRTPRFFTFDPSERYLLVTLQDSDLVRVFRRDPASGLLSATSAALALSKPVCLVFAKDSAR